MNKKLLWYRVGDNSEYHHVGNDIDAICDVLHEAYLGDLYTLYKCNGGIESESYQQANYISLYWGDIKANFEQELSDNEFKYIKYKLRGINYAI